MQATNLNNNKYWSDSDYSAFQATYGALQLAMTAYWIVASAVRTNRTDAFSSTLLTSYHSATPDHAAWLRAAYIPLAAFAYIMCGSFVILTVLLFFGRRAFGTTAGAAAATTGGEAYKPSVGAAMNSSGAPLG